AQQDLVLLAVEDSTRERLNRSRLVALRLVTGNEFEVHKRSSWLFALGSWLEPGGTAALGCRAEQSSAPSRRQRHRGQFRRQRIFLLYRGQMRTNPPAGTSGQLLPHFSFTSPTPTIFADVRNFL